MSIAAPVTFAEMIIGELASNNQAFVELRNSTIANIDKYENGIFSGTINERRVTWDANGLFSEHRCSLDIVSVVLREVTDDQPWLEYQIKDHSQHIGMQAWYVSRSLKVKPITVTDISYSERLVRAGNLFSTQEAATQWQKELKLIFGAVPAPKMDIAARIGRLSGTMPVIVTHGGENGFVYTINDLRMHGVLPFSGRLMTWDRNGKAAEHKDSIAEIVRVRHDVTLHDYGLPTWKQTYYYLDDDYAVRTAQWADLVFDRQNEENGNMFVHENHAAVVAARILQRTV